MSLCALCALPAKAGTDGVAVCPRCAAMAEECGAPPLELELDRRRARVPTVHLETPEDALELETPESSLSLELGTRTPEDPRP